MAIMKTIDLVKLLEEEEFFVIIEENKMVVAEHSLFLMLI
jgi:hypothetical protein